MSRTPAEHAQALRLVASTTLGLAQEIESGILEQIIPAGAEESATLLDDLAWALPLLRNLLREHATARQAHLVRRLEQAEYRLSAVRQIEHAEAL